MSPEPCWSGRRARPATDGLLAHRRESWRRTCRCRASTEAHGQEGPTIGPRTRWVTRARTSSIRRYVAAWRGEHAQGRRGRVPRAEWAPGTAQVDFELPGDTVAGRTVDPQKPWVVTLPHSNACFCAALPCERAEVFCRGLRAVFRADGRAPRLLVLDNATEAGRMAFGKVTESRLSPSSARYRCEEPLQPPTPGTRRGRWRTPWASCAATSPRPGPRGGLAGRAQREARVRLRGRINAGARNGGGQEDRGGAPDDPRRHAGAARHAVDAVRWAHARADKRGYVRVDGNPYTAPAPHGTTVSRWWACAPHCGGASPRQARGHARSFGEGETVRNLVSLDARLVARPRAFGEPTIRGTCRRSGGRPSTAAQGRQEAGAPGTGRAAGVAGFRAACEATEHARWRRVPDEASCGRFSRGARRGAGAAGSRPARLRRVPEAEAIQAAADELAARVVAAGRSVMLTKSVFSPSAGEGAPRQSSTSRLHPSRVREQEASKRKRTS